MVNGVLVVARVTLARSPVPVPFYARNMRRTLWVVALVCSLGLVVGLWAFEPWRLFTHSEIDEAVPAATPAAPSGPGTPALTSEPDVGPTVLSQGEFVDGEHGTEGSAQVLELADGRRFLRLVGLHTSDGPDLHVWLSDAGAGGNWRKYDDGEYLRLGELKATDGNQNYPIPRSADLSRMRSAVIWCDRFNVAFGTAPVRVAG